MELRAAIQGRRSGRAFASRPVEPAEIERLLEAARAAPSGANRQPWRFLVVDTAAPEREALEAALEPGNRWARAAPVLIVSGARPADSVTVEGRQ